MVVRVNTRQSSRFDRGTCGKKIFALQQDPGFMKNTPVYFLQDPDTGLLYNGYDNMTVTEEGCHAFCGSGTFYWDALSRLTIWLLPVLLLLSNIELSPIDKKRFMTIIHALGDPIDSLWSLSHKIYIWHRLYAIGLKKSPATLGTHGKISRRDRARIIATVLAGFEEISGARIESEDYYHMITKQLGRLGEDNEDNSKFLEWHRTARILADARTNEFSRTCLTILVYIFGLIAAFIPEIGGGGENTSPPGGRIASAIFLSWLVPLALLSNSIGAFTSRRSCLTIMRDFVRRTMHTANNNHEIHEDSCNSNPAFGEFQENSANEISRTPRIELQEVSVAPVTSSQPSTASAIRLIDKSSWDDYFESLQWLGAIYTYRPWKVLYLAIDHRTHAHRTNIIMALLGFFPIAVSTVGAFIILWFAVPQGFSCRHLWVLGIFILWVVSAIITSTLYRRCRAHFTGHQLWVLILLKDAFVSILGVSIIALSTAGLFNNCWCWSTHMQHLNTIYVPLNVIHTYELNAKSIYSFVVAACMTAQVLFYLGIISWYRHGMKLVRWTESRRRREWELEVHNDVQYTAENFLIFWYYKENLENVTEEVQEQHRKYSVSRSKGQATG